MVSEDEKIIKVEKIIFLFRSLLYPFKMQFYLDIHWKILKNKNLKYQLIWSIKAKIPPTSYFYILKHSFTSIVPVLMSESCASLKILPCLNKGFFSLQITDIHSNSWNKGKKRKKERKRKGRKRRELMDDYTYLLHSSLFVDHFFPQLFDM